MILLFLTTIIPAAVAVLPGLSRHTPIVIDSTETCKFHLGSKQYDLCPIFGGAAVQWPLLVKSDQAEYRVHLGLDAELNGNDLGGHCPSGTRICLISAQNQPRKAIGSSTITVYSEESSYSLSLRFDGGVDGAAEVRLVCDTKEPGEPVFSRAMNGLHSFIWRTKHACETEVITSESIFNALDMESDIPPPDDNSDSSEPDEGEQLLDNERQRKSRRSMAILFAVISIIIILISIISYKHSNRLNFFFAEYIRPILHRISLDSLPRLSLPNSLKPAGESRLVRWAEEDLELDEDTMVNGSDAYDEPEDAGDEYIPLRPSPRKGGRVVKNYGSATSPFW
ncbi:hypothetical protein MVEN_00202900 [Mycena venus]|uniref:Autophagy-related protein 27 n=1 Tax=Mycena venus TaxID=2733690 RepID=A0A8H6YX91_9AGAR|nr:hypothetical protein MVEN_00202900 [Mycena venus]